MICCGGGRRWERRETGQVTVLLVGFAVSLLLVIAAVTDLSTGYLQRQSAASLADGAALAAVSQAGPSVIYRSDDPSYVPVDEASARTAVQTYLHSTGAYVEHPGLRVSVAVDGHTVQVWVAFGYRLPVPVPGVARTVTVDAVSSAAMPIY